MPDPGEDVEQQMNKMVPASESSQYRERQVCKRFRAGHGDRKCGEGPAGAAGPRKSAASLRGEPAVQASREWNGEDSRCES